MRNKILAYAVGAVCLVASPSMQAINVYAAEAYSSNWTNEKADLSGTWYYYMNDGSLCTSAWVHDNGQWYLLDTNGDMLTGVVKSNGGKYYLLDTVRGTGTYGKMLTNGSVYNGVTISASVNEADEGSLSADTIAQLRAANVNVDNVPNVENTKHVEGGVVVYQPTSGNSGNTNQPSTPQENLNAQPSGGGSDRGSNPFRLPGTAAPEITGGGTGLPDGVYGSSGSDNPFADMYSGLGDPTGSNIGATADIPMYG